MAKSPQTKKFKISVTYRTASRWPHGWWLQSVWQSALLTTASTPRFVSSTAQATFSGLWDIGLTIAENYAQNRLDDPLRPGALGLGQARATNLNDAFQFIVYLSPTGWAIVADTWLGRYKTICIATASDFIGPCGMLFRYWLMQRLSYWRLGDLCHIYDLRTPPQCRFRRSLVRYDRRWDRSWGIESLRASVHGFGDTFPMIFNISLISRQPNSTRKLSRGLRLWRTRRELL